MKKSVLFLTAALSFGVAGAQAPVTTTAAQAPALTDVPAGHWAKDAVERLVSQGIILGYPDGTYRGTQTLTRYEAAMIISRLLDQVGNGEVNLGDLDDATMTSVRNAINELSAELAALDVRVSDLENSAVSREDFARLEGRVDAIAASDAGQTAEQLAAINEMATLLNQDVLELQDRVTVIDGELATFDERLGLVEDQVAENTTDIDAQGIRIANLENGRVSLTLGVKGGYGNLDLVKGNTNFDVDRLTENTFAVKEFSAQPDDKASDRVRKPDTDKFEDGFDGGVTFGLKAENIDAGNGVVVEEAGLDFGVALAQLTKSVALGNGNGNTDKAVVTLEGAYVTGRIGEDARFRALADAGQLNLRPDVVNPVGKLADKPGYNDYLLPSGGHNGVAAGVALTDVPLKPTVYLGAGYGNEDQLDGPWFAARTEVKLGDKGDIGVSFAQNSVIEGEPYTGGRTAFGVDASYTQPKADDNEEVLYGVKAVYVASMSDVFAANQQRGTTGLNPVEPTFSTLWDGRDQAAVIKAEANLFNVGLDANLRAVSPGFADGKANMDIDGDDAEFTNEVGYGASASTKLGTVEVGAFGDTYTNWYDEAGTNRRTGFGAHAGVNLGAFRAVAFGARATDERDFERVTNANGTVTYLNDKTFLANNTLVSDPSGETSVDSGFVFADGNVAKSVVRYNADQVASVKREDIFKPAKAVDLYRYTSSVGGLLTHDGSQENPLIPNLDLAIGGNYYYDSGDSYLAAMAAYNAKVNSDITVTPFVGYSMYQQAEADRFVYELKDGVVLTDKPLAAASAADNTKLTYGVDVKTQPFNVAFRPDLKINIAKSDYTTGSNDVTFNGSEIGAKVQVGLNEFFTPAAKLNLGYAFHRADNLVRASANPADFAFGGAVAAPKAGVYGQGADTQTQGVFTQLSWNDALKFNYGVFLHDADTNNPNDTTNVAQGFKVSYGVKF